MLEPGLIEDIASANCAVEGQFTTRGALAYIALHLGHLFGSSGWLWEDDRAGSAMFCSHGSHRSGSELRSRLTLMKDKVFPKQGEAISRTVVRAVHRAGVEGRAGRRTAWRKESKAGEP